MISSLCTTGIVTCVAWWQANSCVIAPVEDPNGRGTYVMGQRESDVESKASLIGMSELTEGDIVEVRGSWQKLLFAPGINATEITKRNQSELSAAPHREFFHFHEGRMDNQRATVDGVVRELRKGRNGSVELMLGMRGGILPVRARNGRIDEAIVDAEVSICGTIMSTFNHRGEFLRPRMEIGNLSDVLVRRRGTKDPFALELSPIKSLCGWKEVPDDGHLKHVRGVVVGAMNTVIYLQEDDRVIRCVCKGDSICPAQGETIDVCGFADMSGTFGELHGARWRKVDAPIVNVEPIEMVGKDFLALRMPGGNSLRYRDYEGRLVKVRGRLYNFHQWDDNKAELVLDAGNRTIVASWAGKLPDSIANVQPGDNPLVEIIGVCRITLKANPTAARPELERTSLECDGSNGSLIVLDNEAEHERQRLKAMEEESARSKRLVRNLLLSFGFFTLFAIVVVAKINRKRREDEILLKERKRMAGDLHDTIEQHLAGAKILLQTAINTPELPGDAAVPIKMAFEVLANAKAEVRDTVMNLRSDEASRRSVADSLRAMARSINRAGAVRVHVRLGDFDPKLTASQRFDLLSIVQEAITNAMKHGGARNVAIAVEGVRARALGVRLLVANDGAPFDAAEALGPEAGHYGLTGMRERALRSGFGIDWTSDEKWMKVEIRI